MTEANRRVKTSTWLAGGFDRTIRFFSFLAGALIIFMMLAICYEVVLRYFFSRTLQWVTPTAEYILLWATFLGSAWVLKIGGHVRVDILLRSFSPKIQSSLTTITSLVGAASCLVVTGFGAQSTWDFYQRHVMVIEAVKFPQYPIIAVIPVCSFLLSVQFLRIASKEFLNPREPHRIKQDYSAGNATKSQGQNSDQETDSNT